MDYQLFYDEFFSAFVFNHGGLQGNSSRSLTSQKIFRKCFAVVIEELREHCDVSGVEAAFLPLRRADHIPVSYFPTPEFLNFERQIRDLLESLDNVANRPVARTLFQCLREFVSQDVDVSRRVIKVLHNYPSSHRDFEFEYFLVHGTDVENRTEQIVSVLTGLGLPAPTILGRQAGGGSTLLTKFEKTARLASAAVILVTPDDVGKRKDEPDLRPRARQNVWFEAGFFRGVLPENRVIFLKSTDIEIPSDIGNISYVDMEQDNWKSLFIKELLAAEIPINHASATAVL